MNKKTINPEELSFVQSINISCQWCKEWEDELLSDEVLADRINELIKNKNGIRGFFAYALSDMNCTLLDKLPTALIFIFRVQGVNVVDISIKNFIMSNAQIINHRRDKNKEYEAKSKIISERCANLIQSLDTELITNKINQIIKELDHMGNSFDDSIKYDKEQKEYILRRIDEIAIKKGPN